MTGTQFNKDPFALLGLQRTATEDEIKKKYRELARLHHPDHHKDDPQAEIRFQEISWAYSKIGKAADRLQYLQSVYQPKKSPADLGEEFASYFRRDDDTLAQRGVDIKADVSISFAESFTGKKVDLPVRTEQLCTFCGGSGAAGGTVPYPCDVCHGRGELAVGRLTRPCVKCHGRGMIIQSPCTHCFEGKTVQEVVHHIEIPAGIRDGSPLRVEGAGGVGWAESGDLVVNVHVSSSAVFRVMETMGDLEIDVPVHYSEAALGANIKVPTPDGRAVVLRLPPGSSSGKKLRMRGMGMPIPSSTERGNLYVVINILAPVNLTEEQRRIISQLQVHDDRTIRQDLLDNSREIS